MRQEKVKTIYSIVVAVIATKSGFPTTFFCGTDSATKYFNLMYYWSFY